MKFKLYLTIITPLIILFGCNTPPDYPDEPVIEFLSMSPDTVSQFETFRIEFTFTDGNGDIGFIETDTFSCNPCTDSCLLNPDLTVVLMDNRTNCMVIEYHLPFIPPKGSSDAISGIIEILVSTCCIPPSGFPCTSDPSYPLDTVSYSITIRDRAGNFSNTIVTPQLFLVCNN